jgi:beta-galactosidase
MTKHHNLLFALLAAVAPGLFNAGVSQAQTSLFDFDWRFHRGGWQGAEMPETDVSAWRKTDLPHDWSIEDIPGSASPFSPVAPGQVSTGFTVGGTGWYRKNFSLPARFRGKKVSILFEGVYMNADVWLNGVHLGGNPYGYTSFWFDLTPHLKFDEENIIAVQVKNEGQTSRWYSGSGIYRHVWLRVAEAIHPATWGTFVTTPVVGAASAQVSVRTKVLNESNGNSPVTLRTIILDAQHREVGQSVSTQDMAAQTQHEFSQTVVVSNPRLWSPDTPVLYKAVTILAAAGQPGVADTTYFGIRTISFDSENGFRLNGRPMKLKGGCVHHDNGPLGARAYDRAEERRVELLKASGYNAVRCAHNPPSPAFLQACDRLGMLVINEAFDVWLHPNNPHDYHLYFKDWWKRDIESMVARDRNHPSIIMWSIGNEIKGMDSPEVVAVAQQLAGLVRRLDPTRPVTAAVNNVTDLKDSFFDALDVAGYNYARHRYQPDGQRKPGRVMYSSESYPLEAFEYWMDALKHPWVAGDFVWTAFDYLGEASIGWRGYMQEQNFFPWNVAFCGDIDICGWKRPQSHYRDALWSNHALSLFVAPPTPSFPVNPKREDWSIWHWHDVTDDWTWPQHAHQPLDVVVYSSCDYVELFLNGKSLGKKPTGPSDRFMATWTIPFRPGELKAVGFRGRKPVAQSALQTAGPAAKIELRADRRLLRADGQDLSFITVELADEKGVRNPKAEDLIRFEVSGPGQIVAVANANPMSVESFQQPYRKAWRGRAMVIVKAGSSAGEIKLRAAVAGLPPSEILINVR